MKEKMPLPPVDWLQERANEILSVTDEGLIESGLREVLRFYEPLNYTINYSAPLWRGRRCKNKNGFELFSDVHYPPAECAKAGRFNDSCSPLLYVSFGQFTALSEIRAKTGDIVQVVGYRTFGDRPIRCLAIGEFANIHLRGHGHLQNSANTEIATILGKLGFEPGLSFVFLDSFLAAVMSTQHMESTNHLHSRTLARLLFEAYPGISALHYPSVARRGAMNLAVKPNAADEALRFVGTSVLEIERAFDFGLYRFSAIRHSTRLEANGSIVWDGLT